MALLQQVSHMIEGEGELGKLDISSWTVASFMDQNPTYHRCDYHQSAVLIECQFFFKLG